ncbi:hypothetical protein ACS0TY_003124 [Phlomoides rotata]
MAPGSSSDSDLNQIIIEENHNVRKIIFNRPRQLNSLNPEMGKIMKKALKKYEADDTVGVIIVTGQGKVFSAGGDIASYYHDLLAGDWSKAVGGYNKQLLLEHRFATYKKPVVMLMNGVVMGGGAALAMNGNFRIVTENTVFSIPEVFIGFFPDVGISYFLSQLSGYYGEYLGLTGARISGTEMLASGLATHFVLSKDLKSLENELSKIAYMDGSAVVNVLKKFAHQPNLESDSAFARLDIINKCFSKNTVEDILSTLESEVEKCGDGWMIYAVMSMKSASPTSLKICLKNIREGRKSTREECLRRDYTLFRHFVRGKLSRDIFEGVRAVTIDKDRRPKWNPQKLEEVSDELVNQFFQDLDNDEDWDCLEIPDDRKITKIKTSKL